MVLEESLSCCTCPQSSFERVGYLSWVCFLSLCFLPHHVVLSPLPFSLISCLNTAYLIMNCELLNHKPKRISFPSKLLLSVISVVVMKSWLIQVSCLEMAQLRNSHPSDMDHELPYLSFPFSLCSKFYQMMGFLGLDLYIPSRKKNKSLGFRVKVSWEAAVWFHSWDCAWEN